VSILIFEVTKPCLLFLKGENYLLFLGLKLKTMSHSDSPKQGSLFLWFIIPFAAILTLMFVNINNNAAAPMTKLPGSVPAKEVEEVKHEDDNAAADTPSADAPAAAEGPEVAHPEEVKIENQKIVKEAAPAEHKDTEHKGR
jgi:hypothetical protein